MQDFMRDRYGVDDLSTALGAAGVVLTLVGTIFNLRAVSIVALIVLVIALLRSFSKNAAARRGENEAFQRMLAKLPVVGERFGGPRGGAARSARAAGPGAADDLKRQARTAKKMWKERKTKSFIKCPNCGTMLSVPKGKGKIIVTCPKCHARMEAKS